MRRRDFLIGAAAMAGAAALPRRGWAARLRQQAALDRIGIMTYSLHPIVKLPDEPASPERTLDINDIPEMFADRYGVHNIEMQHENFFSTEPAYLRDYRARVERARSRISQINVELGSHNISAPELTTRLETIDLTKKWIDHAVILGSPRVMVNQGGLSPEVMATAAEALRAMGRYGDSQNVWVTMENRGNNWKETAEVVRTAGTYTTPDMGNFPDQENQLLGIRALFPMNRGNAHVKLRPERYDLPTAIALTKELGYSGLYSIEAGSNVDPDRYVAVQKIRDLLVEHV